MQIHFHRNYHNNINFFAYSKSPLYVRILIKELGWSQKKFKGFQNLQLPRAYTGWIGMNQILRNNHASEPMRLPWWMRMMEVGHYVVEVGHHVLEVEHYASSGRGIILQVVDANIGGGALCLGGRALCLKWWMQMDVKIYHLQHYAPPPMFAFTTVGA